MRVAQAGGEERHAAEGDGAAIKYDFNDQGYDFAKGATFTNHDIYRQPDAVGGYSYVMLLAWS